MTWETASYIVAVIVPCSGVAIFLYRRYISPIHAKVKVIWAEATANGGKSIKDTVTRIDTVVKEIRDQLAASANRSRILLQSHDTPVFETDAQGEYVWVNDAYLELVGRPLTDITQSGWFTHVRQKERELIRAEWEAAIEQERDFDMNYTIHNHKLHTSAYVRARASVLRGQTGNVMGYLGSIEVLRREQFKRD